MSNYPAQIIRNKQHITKRGGKWLLIDGRGTTICDTFEFAACIARYRHAWGPL